MPYRHYPSLAPEPTMASVFDHFDGCLIVLDPLYNILYFNGRASYNYHTLMGLNLCAGSNFLQLSPHDNNKSFVRNFTTALGGKSVAFERRSDKDDGWIEGRLSPFCLSDGSIAGVIYTFVNITDRKNLELAIEEGHSVMRAIESNDLQAFVLMDETGHLIKWNRKAQQLILKENAALVKGTPMRDLVPLDWVVRLGVLLKVARSGGVVSDEFELGANGNPRIVEVHLEQVHTTDGILLCLWGHDITEQRQAERALKISEGNLRAVLDSSTHSFVLLDRHFKIVSFNYVADRIAQLLFDMPLSIGAGLEGFVLEDGREETIEQITRAFKGQRVATEKSILLNGQVRWFEKHYDPIFDHDGKVNLVTFWSYDITERKIADEAIRVSEERFRQMVMLVPVGIYQTDRQGNVLLFNQAMSDISGISFEQLTPERWVQMTHPDDREAAHLEWEKAIGQGLPYEREYRFIKDNGETLQIYEKAAPLHNLQGEPIGHIGSMVDITLQTRARELAQQKALAERSLKFRSDFLASMSHEIRTPLSGIMGMAELLRDAQTDPAMRTYAENILLSATDLRSIVNEVLELSQLEAGKVTVADEEVNMRDLITHVVGQHRVDAEAKGLVLGVVLDPDLPNTIRSDRRRIAQVLGNLVRNAIKFTTQGHVTILGKGDNVGCVRLEVRDTGKGIPEAEKGKLFKQFSQLNHTTAQDLEGTGLGLYISSKIVQMLGGEMGVESQAGSGSTFWFTVKCARAIKKPGPQKTDDQRSLQGVRVLLVEDNLINQTAFKTMLRRMGCEVTACASGKQALDHFDHDKFDIVFMDIQMPDMDGIEATARLKSKTTVCPPIIGLSGNILERDDQGNLSTGMDDMLLKPVVSEELERTIRKWVD